jgi:hypothetical protein
MGWVYRCSHNMWCFEIELRSNRLKPMTASAIAAEDAVQKVLEILQNEKNVKAEAILHRLQKSGFDEKNAREAIAILLDKNAVVFDREWRLQPNPVFGTKAA